MRFIVKTDNGANTFFRFQKKLSPKQAQWEAFLPEYDFVWEHKLGKHNQVVDTLSRKEAVVTLYNTTHVQADMIDIICIHGIKMLVTKNWFSRLKIGL